MIVCKADCSGLAGEPHRHDRDNQSVVTSAANCAPHFTMIEMYKNSIVLLKSYKSETECMCTFLSFKHESAEWFMHLGSGFQTTKDKRMCGTSCKMLESVQ